MKSDFRLAICYSNLSDFKIIVMHMLKSELMTQGVFAMVDFGGKASYVGIYRYNMTLFPEITLEDFLFM